jgi:hypothetical protein
MSKKSKYSSRVKWLVVPLIAVVTFGLTKIAAQNPQATESIYSQTIYPVFASSLSTFSTIFPFSLDDIFYLFLIAAILILIALLVLGKISFKKTGKIILNVLAVTYILFYLLWGFNYFRKDLNRRLNLAEQKPSIEKFVEQLEMLIENTNRSYCKFNNFDKKVIDSLIELSYKNLSPVLKFSYPTGKRNDKKITFSRFFASAGISGYYGPFFNEVHVNKKLLPIEYPFVLAHEKAHQLGVTSEAEANFYSWLVCSQSGSEQLQYSANLYVLKFFLYQAYQLEAYSKLIKKLDVNVKIDLKEIQKYWDKLRNEKVKKVAAKVNDTYLKTNKVEKGIEDYFGVVKFVIDFQTDYAFQKKYGLKIN